MPTNLFKTCFKENVFVFYVSFRPTFKLCVFLYEKKNIQYTPQSNYLYWYSLRAWICRLINGLFWR